MLPAIESARKYQKQWLRFDISAGIIIASLAIPQSIAYAQIVNLAPISGLLATIVSMLLYSLLGGSRQLMMGPEASVSLLVATTLASMSDGDIARYAALAAAQAVIVGVVLILGAILRLGFLADMFGRALIVGYLSGIAILMLFSQLGKFLGIDLNTDTVYGAIMNLVQDNYTILPLAAAFGFGALIIQAILTWRWPRFPSALLVLVLGIILVNIFNISPAQVPQLGQFSQDWTAPDPSLLTWHDLWILVPGALGISLIVFTEGVLTGRAFSLRHGYRIKPTQELVAFGSINIATGIIGAWSMATSNSRTAVGDAAGGKTQLTGVAAAIAILITLPFTFLLETLPMPIIGSVIVIAAWRLIDIRQWRRIWSVRHSEGLLAILTALGVIVLGPLPGILVAVAASFANILRRVILPYRAELGLNERGEYVDKHRHDVQTNEDVAIYRFGGPLFFANARLMREELRELGQDHPVVILDAEAITDLDTDGVEALFSARRELAAENSRLIIAELKGPLRDILYRADQGWDEHIYLSVNAAVKSQNQESSDHQTP